MSIKQLFDHFQDKNIWVDIATPLYRTRGKMRDVEKSTSVEILNMSVSVWTFSSNNILQINM